MSIVSLKTLFIELLTTRRPIFNGLLFCIYEMFVFSGDERITQNPELSVMELIFYKLHQRIASSLKDSKMNDEKIYQETRRYLIAIYQHIVYGEFLPITIG